MKKAYEKFCRFEQALAIFLLSLITILVFAAALTRAGAKCELYDVTADRKLPHAFSALLPEYPESQEVNALLASFLLGTEK